MELSYLRNVVTLRVDAGRLEAGVSGGGEEMLNTFHELFLGGFPGESGVGQTIYYMWRKKIT